MFGICVISLLQVVDDGRVLMSGPGSKLLDGCEVTPIDRGSVLVSKVAGECEWMVKTRLASMGLF